MVWLETQPRATRFLIRAPLHFREYAASVWQEAWTVNLSRSGVLFRTKGRVPGVGRAMEFLLEVPLDGRREPLGIRGAGHVVRLAAEALDEGERTVGMAIDSYSLGTQSLYEHNVSPRRHPLTTA